MLVEMNISVWTANKLDRNATDTVTTNNYASSSAAKVHKNLMAGTSLRKEISDFGTACNGWHRSRTIPWADKGARLLPTSLFLDYKTEANQRRDKFNHMVENFLREYPNLIQQSASHLGALFNRNDYPSVEEVASKFGMRLVFSPVPESNDFRLAVPAQELEELKGQYEESFKSRLADAMKEPWDRLHTVLSAISTKLIDKENPEERTCYHTSLITNAQSLCALLTHLNITSDPKLEAARRELERALVGVEIDDLRDSPVVRADVKARVDAVLKQYEW
jgi:hypothetical protein